MFNSSLRHWGAFHCVPPVTALTSAVVTAVALAALPGGPLPAQMARPANDTLAYIYLRGADTVAIERMVSHADGVRGELVVKGQPRAIWYQHIAGTLPGTFDLDAFAATASPGAAPAQSVSLRVVGDSGFMDIHSNGATNTAQRLKVNAGAEWMLNNSVLHTDLLASLAVRRKQDTVNVVLAQGGAQIPMAVRRSGDTTFVSVAGSSMRFLRDARGLIEASTGNNTVRRVAPADLGKLSAKAAADKLSYTAPAGAPYTAEDVVINTEGGFQLAGTLTHPRGTARVPVVITISGSGPQERDSRLLALPGMEGYALFRDIADTLGRRGIAVLRVDDRGIGASTGRESLAVATSADFANDVREVLKYVRSRKDIDTSRIALVGHSEGGMIAPMVASQDKAVRAIALLAGSAYTGRRISMMQNRDTLNRMVRLTPAARDSIMATVPAALDRIAAASPWYGFFAQHDPLRVARLVTQPVLILQGDKDTQVSPEQADTLALALRESGNTDVTVRHFPNTNHLFLADSVGGAAGYASLSDKHVRRTVLGALADWLGLKLR